MCAVAAFLLANVAVLVVGRAFAIPIGHLDQLTPEQIGILTAGQDLTLGLSWSSSCGPGRSSAPWIWA